MYICNIHCLKIANALVICHRRKRKTNLKILCQNIIFLFSLFKLINIAISSPICLFTHISVHLRRFETRVFRDIHAVIHNNRPSMCTVYLNMSYTIYRIKCLADLGSRRNTDDTKGGSRNVWGEK